MIFDYIKTNPVGEKRKALLSIVTNALILSGIDYIIYEDEEKDYLSGNNNYDYGEVCLPIRILGNYSKAYASINSALKNTDGKISKEHNNTLLLTLNDTIKLSLPSTYGVDIHELIDNTPWERIFISTDWHIFGDKYGKGKNMVNIYNIVKWCKNHIKDNDIFIHLGDLTHRFCKKDDQEKAMEIYKSIPGIKVLILGNHDIPLGPEFYNNCGFDYVFKELIHGNLIFTHRPAKVELMPGIETNLHGHKHDVTDYNITSGGNNINCYPIFFNNKPVTLKYALDHKDKLTKNNIRVYWTNYTEAVEKIMDNAEKNTNDVNVDSSIIIHSEDGMSTKNITDIKFWFVSPDKRFPENLSIDDYRDYLIDAIDAIEDSLPDNQVYVFTCNGEEDANNPICVGIASVDENKQIKWEIQYPMGISNGKYYSLLKANEWAMASTNPIIGIKQPFVLKVKEEKDSMSQYIFTPNIIDDKYFIINEDANIELVDRKSLEEYYIVKEYKFVGDYRNIDKIYKAYKEHKTVDNTFFYTALSRKPLLSEDQMDFDYDFEDANISYTALNNSINNYDDYPDIEVDTIDEVSVRYNINGYYAAYENKFRSDYFSRFGDARDVAKYVASKLLGR